MRLNSMSLAPILGILLSGCGDHRTLPATQASRLPVDLVAPTYEAVINARVTPPVGWKPDPLKSSAMHKHQVWISPSGRTAYGVIYFTLPLPVGHDLTLWGFMNEMRRSEGEATLVSKQWDPDMKALHFVARGGRYVVRTNLVVRGFHGWAVYAGTLRNDEVIPDELAKAELARDATRLGEHD